MPQELYMRLRPNEFRELVVQPGQKDEPVKCTLQTSNLIEATLKYEAISYTWGDETQRGSIFVNTIPRDVIASAAAALKTIRSPLHERTVFIDYVCINQQDISERSSQVAQMSFIYEKALRVLVSLDEDSENGKRAFNEIEALAEEALAEMAVRQLSLREITNGHDGDNLFAKSSPSRIPDLGSLAWLYNHEWFNRVWVIQEVILSSACVVLAGSASVDFVTLLLATDWFYYIGPSLDNSDVADDIDIVSTLGFLSARKMRKLKILIESRDVYDHPLNALLTYAPFGECKDLRDQVYGVLGLYRQLASENTIPPQLTPDYSRKSVEVFRTTTRFAIEQQEGLSMLENDHAKRPDRPPGLPTWVVEWFRQSPDDDRILPWRTLGSNACGLRLSWRRTELLPTADPNVLSLKGLFLDLIDECPTPPLTTHDDLDAFRTHMQSIDRISRAASVDSETLGMTVIAGRWGSESGFQRATVEQARTWTDFLQYLNRIETLPAWSTESLNGPNRAVTLFFFSLGAGGGRNFFSTKSGLIGLGPLDIASDDVLVLLQGANLPYVLRPVGDQFTFLGLAYVHNIMHGEAIEEHLRFSGTSDPDEEPDGDSIQFSDASASEQRLRPWRGETKPKEMIFNII